MAFKWLGLSINSSAYHSGTKHLNTVLVFHVLVIHPSPELRLLTLQSPLEDDVLETEDAKLLLLVIQISVCNSRDKRLLY